MRIGVAGTLAAALALSGACRRADPASKNDVGAKRQAEPSPGAPTSSAASPSARSVQANVRHVPACELVSQAEMSALLSAPVGKVIGESSDAKTSCAYPPGEAGSWAQAEIAIEWNYRGAATFEKQMTDAFGGSAVGRQVAHTVALGDAASYTREGALSIRLGSALITITVPMRADSEEHTTAIGRTVVERLGGVSVAAASRAPEKAAPSKAPKEEDVFKGLLSMFGEDSKPETKPAEPPAPQRLAHLPIPEGLQPDERCPDPGPGADAEIAAAAATIPLKQGLTLSRIWTYSADNYDHECLSQITRLDRKGFDTTVRCPIGADRHIDTESRRICWVDLRDSYMYETAHSPTLPETLLGALQFSISTKSFNELKIGGRTRHRYIEINSHGGTPWLVEDSDGTVDRGQTRTFTVVVNDRPVALPVVEAVGAYTSEGKPNRIALAVLDDARFPLVLDYRHEVNRFAITFTKISFPTEGELEKHLTVDKHVDVYGIYFDFASDRLRPESAPVLREISEVLAKNPAWTLTINGHTDNVGGDAFNMDLSKRRSASVRRELAATYHVEPARLLTAGFGASQPKASNATVEGRSKNRRVELVRQ